MFFQHFQYFEIFSKCKIDTFQRNLSRIFLKVLNICLFTKIFQKFKIVMLQGNILQFLTKMLQEYFNCNERFKIFLTCFCNILCYVGIFVKIYLTYISITSKHISLVKSCKYMSLIYFISMGMVAVLLQLCKIYWY